MKFIHHLFIKYALLSKAIAIIWIKSNTFMEIWQSKEYLHENIDNIGPWISKKTIWKREVVSFKVLNHLCEKKYQTCNIFVSVKRVQETICERKKPNHCKTLCCIQVIRMLSCRHILWWNRITSHPSQCTVCQTHVSSWNLLCGLCKRKPHKKRSLTMSI